MGYTNHEIQIISNRLGGVKSVLDFGSQNLYINGEKDPPFVSEWYKSRGITDYTCIDLAGDNNALKYNWSYPIDIFRKFDLVVDAGSGEHSAQSEEYLNVAFHDGYINSIYPKGHPSDKAIELGFYHCFLNKHNLLKVGGLMINVNPLSGDWKNHGYSYFGEYFYVAFTQIAGYELIETGINCAMGNCVDGKNVYGIIKKTSEQFPSFEEFYKQLPIYKS